MRNIASRITALSVIAVLVIVQAMPGASAQTPLPTPQQLDQLLAPIALYPDSLLAQITTASTNPQEILDVDNWLASQPMLSGTALSDAAQRQGFDPAFIALVYFPGVLQMMAENIDDYAAIGNAVLADQAAVSASIQHLRAQAYASGALRSTAQQLVTPQQMGGQTYYVIQPANPQVVYVPQYDPTVVYVGPGRSTFLTTSMVSFGLGIGIGALIADNRPWGWGGWGWNWGGRSIYFNHGAWGGWRGGYRPSRTWYSPRPVPYASRPGFGGNWRYRPPSYRPQRPIGRPQPVRPGPGSRPTFNRPGARPGTPSSGPHGGKDNPPNAVRPPAQPDRPGAAPSHPDQTSPSRPQHPAPSSPQRPEQGRPGSSSHPEQAWSLQRPSSQKSTPENRSSHDRKQKPLAKTTPR